MQISYDVDPPFAIQLEPVEGCSLACSFCGLQSIRDNGADAELGIHGKNSAPYRYATVEMIDSVAKQAAELGWNPRWEFAMHGEPTVHPNLHKMIAAVRRHNPKGYIMVTSNGSGLLKETYIRILSFFSAGLNTLALDDYKHSGGWIQRIQANLEEDDLGLYDFETLHYPREKDGNPHQRHNKRKLVYLNDIADNSSGTHQLTNQGGNSFAKTEVLAARCAKPFRELSVRWDGSVAICCDDWPGKYKIGNVNDVALEQIWYSEEFEAARRRLYAKDRAFGPCYGCNVTTYRNGLLPDKLGKAEMLPPDEESNAVIKRALRGKTFSIKLAKGD